MVEQPTLTPWASGGDVEDSALYLCRDQVKVDVARKAGYNLNPVCRDILYFFAWKDGVVEIQGSITWPRTLLSHACTRCRAGEKIKLGV